MNQATDPLVGIELTRILLEICGVRFEFPNSTIEIYSDFVVKIGDRVLEKIYPTAKTGNIGALWSIVGTIVTELTWANSSAESMVIMFSNGIIVEVPPDTGPRGTIFGFYDDKHTVDEF